MKRLIYSKYAFLLGGAAVIFGMILLVAELFALQFFHYYLFTNAISDTLPHEFLSKPAILIAFILTLVMIISGLAVIVANLLSPKTVSQNQE